MTTPSQSPSGGQAVAPDANQLTRELFPELCTGLSDDTAEFMRKRAIVERFMPHPVAPEAAPKAVHLDAVGGNKADKAAKDAEKLCASPSDGGTPDISTDVPADWSQSPERIVHYWRTLANDQADIVKQCWKALGGNDDQGNAPWEAIASLRAALAAAQAELKEAKKERDEAKRLCDLAGRVLVGDDGDTTLAENVVAVQIRNEQLRRQRDENARLYFHTKQVEVPELTRQLAALRTQLATQSAEVEAMKRKLTHPTIHVDYYAWLETLTDFEKKFRDEHSKDFAEFHAIAMWVWTASREHAAKP